MFIEEGGEKLLEINVSTPTKTEAEKMCTKWMQAGSRLYPLIMGELIK